jgi:YVTN family beta-propeller protein
MRFSLFPSLILAGFAAGSASAQHAQVSAVVVNPANNQQVWVCNRDNNSVSLVDAAAGTVIAEIPVGVNPRSLTLSADGTQLFVANQRGNIALSANAVTGFPAGSDAGTVTVIDTATRSVQSTIGQVGVEPYGILVSPNGKYIAVSNFRSGNIRLLDATTFLEVARMDYMANLSFIPAPFTIADADENRDGIADLGEPRGFTIRDNSAQIYVTHNRSPYVSVLDVSLDAQGVPTSLALNAKIDLNTYAPNTHLNPVPVQTLLSQGLPRFAEDIALSPDGTRALIPHVLHNINHDVNHAFAGLAGDFANRVYPALTVLDAANQSYNAPADTSTRLHHELSDSLIPASWGSFSSTVNHAASGDPIILGLAGSPTIGSSIQIRIPGVSPSDNVRVYIGTTQANHDLGALGVRVVRPRITLTAPGGVVNFNIPNNPIYNGVRLIIQAYLPGSGYSNGLHVRVGSDTNDVGELGYRAGQPSRVLYNAAGTSAVMLNRGSEDLFLFDVANSDLSLRTVFPDRVAFVERAALDNNTSLGDMPVGMAMVEDTTTANDDALIYVINEGNRTLSSLRVDFTAGTIIEVNAQIPTITSTDLFTLSERIGQELFEDASRAQTTGNFNNSCASCHFEGGADGNVWQRPAGPRSTMPVYGGSLGTGLILWKGVRLNMGETGPMFGGENGGHGLLSDQEQQGLTDWHEKAAIPLNPNRNSDMTLDPVAAFGRDLFFGKNDTGLNPTMRTANCFECHDNVETSATNLPGPRFFTVDFVNPLLLLEANFGALDPNCFSLRENIVDVNLRNVNTGCDVDADGDGFADIDRNNDGRDDRESYTVLNVDADDDFKRDDPNGYQCPCDPLTDPNCDANDPRRLFARDMTKFSIPTKLGVSTTGPYFHDHSVFSLRGLVDPEAQMFDNTYGDPAYGAVIGTRPALFKVYNEAHDIRGHEGAPSQPGDSKVQQTLNSTDANADTDAILRFIQSL